MPFPFTTIILFALLSFLPNLLSQEYLAPRVEIGVSIHNCDDFHYEGDDYLVLTPFKCQSLPVLESVRTFVRTDEWIHPWDVILVLVIASTTEGACAGPVMKTLSYDGHCTSYTSGPAAAILVTMGLDPLFNAHHMPAAMKHTVSHQNEIYFAFPLPIHIDLACQTACTKLPNIHPSSSVNDLTFGTKRSQSILQHTPHAHCHEAHCQPSKRNQPLPIHINRACQAAYTKLPNAHPSSGANNLVFDRFNPLVSTPPSHTHTTLWTSLTTNQCPALR